MAQTSSAFVQDPFNDITNIHFGARRYLALGINIIRTCSNAFQQPRLFRAAQDYILEPHGSPTDPELPGAVPAATTVEVTLRYANNDLFLQNYDGLTGWGIMHERPTVPPVGLYSRRYNSNAWESVAIEGFTLPGEEDAATINGLPTLPQARTLIGALPATGSAAQTAAPQVRWSAGVSEGGSLVDPKGNPIRTPNDGPIFGATPTNAALEIFGVAVERQPGFRVGDFQAYMPEVPVGFIPEAAWLAASYPTVFDSLDVDVGGLSIDWDDKTYTPIGAAQYYAATFNDQRPAPPRTLFVLFKAEDEEE